jgi:hypothetical protein
VAQGEGPQFKPQYCKKKKKKTYLVSGSPLLDFAVWRLEACCLPPRPSSNHCDLDTQAKGLAEILKSQPTG